VTRAPQWSPADIPDLTGKRALVTGVTSGIGESTVLELARHGAEVVLGARNPAKLETTMARISNEVPSAKLHPLEIDVSDLSSVRRAAAEITEPLHLLVNNAGVMATPNHRTADGLELQMATNYFGPFALTGLLFPRLAESGDGRVVMVASQGSRMARRAPLDDPLDQSRRYGKWQAYFASKLADLLFLFELDRRCRDQGVPVKGLAAHPGYASTGLMGTGRNTGNTGERMRLTATILQAVFSAVGQPASLGALPTLMAATADLPGSTYVGPDGWLEFKGQPHIVNARRLAHDRDSQRALWELSEKTTGVSFLDG
jgi:NAD(P)-dependent dehydrogenase (short-subunit alcohol dehydrogenase family)